MTTLKEEYHKALVSQENLGSLTLRQDSKEYQNELSSVIKQFQKCERLVGQLSLFSENETMEDLVTGDIQYLAIDYHIGRLLERVRREGSATANDPETRLHAVEQAVQYQLKFLSSLDSYQILTKQMSQRLNDVLKNGNKLDYFVSKDATTRRQDKIDQFKLERALEEKLKQTSNTLNDEDELRKLKIAELGLKAVKCFSNLETLNMELEMLKNIPKDLDQAQNHQSSSEDSRQRDIQSSSYRSRGHGQGNGYTPGVVDPAANPHSKTPLLTKDGKVNRPFTIVSNREQMKKQVFGTGQHLPTMTVEEYLDEEVRMGRVLQGGEDSYQTNDKDDEDDMDKADQETYKARQWDEFTEANPKGSGNTMNRG